MSISDDQAKYFGLKTGRFQKSVVGTFTGTGSSSSLELLGEFNVLITDGIATVEVKRSFDNGSNWYTVSLDSTGTPASYTTASGVAFNGVVEEREKDIIYKLECTSYTSGTVTYRFSQ